MPAAPPCSPAALRGGPLASLDDVDVTSLRVVVQEDDGVLTPCPAARRAVREATATLTQLGAEVVTVTLPERQLAQHLFMRIVSGDRLAHIRRTLGRSRLDPRIRQMVVASTAPGWMMGALLKLTRRHKVLRELESLSDGSADEYFRMVAELEQLRANALAAMSGADIALSLQSPCQQFGTERRQSSARSARTRRIGTRSAGPQA